MKLAIDTTPLYVTKAGTARYVAGLLGGLTQLSVPGVEIQKVAWEVSNFERGQPARILKTLFRDLVWAKLLAPLRLKRLGSQVLHSTGSRYIRPPQGVRNVVTIHDLAPLRNPGRYRAWHRFRSIRELRAAHRADAITCISEFTAREANELLGIPLSKMRVVYNGCDYISLGGPPPGAKPEFVLPEEFCLFVGSLEPGKNLALLREVYEQAEKSGIALPDLLIVGARWVGTGADDLPRKGWHFLGHVSDENLIYLYRHARLFLFPTKYEGFGLPIAEAMALGCPVVCGRVASLPEVGGDAAVYAELNPVDFLKQTASLLADPIRHRETVAAGLAQAAKFSWEKCAREMMAVYQSVL